MYVLLLNTADCNVLYGIELVSLVSVSNTSPAQKSLIYKDVQCDVFSLITANAKLLTHKPFGVAVVLFSAGFEGLLFVAVCICASCALSAGSLLP